jgi:hypothetical protein
MPALSKSDTKSNTIRTTSRRITTIPRSINTFLALGTSYNQKSTARLVADTDSRPITCHAAASARGVINAHIPGWTCCSS